MRSHRQRLIKVARAQACVATVATSLMMVIGGMMIAGAGPVIVPQPPAGEPLLGLTPGQLNDFIIGQSEFATPFVAEDGLGPIFNEVSCGACHTMPLGGPGPTTVTRFGQFQLGVFDPLEHLGGPLLQEFALEGVCVEQIPPEANIVIERATPGALGYGLIESILDADLQALESTPPLPGISGRAHMVFAIEDEGVGPIRVGRFGWKSQLPTMLSFSEDAALFEMGLTDRFPGFGQDLDPNGDTDPFCDDDELDPELPQDQTTGLYFTDRVALFQRYLAAPPQTPQSGMSGEVIFDTIGCTSCHVGQFITSGLVPETALQTQLIRPYSDFLLHDMGAAADGLPQGDAEANEMRTTVLWGLRSRNPLWHDGSIFSLDFEQRVTTAIELHGMAGSEAHAAGIVGDATTPGAWDLLPAADKSAVIAFLGSLGRREFDTNADGIIDFDDFLAFSDCFTGPGTFYTPDDACSVSDIDQDGDVDLDDYASFQLVYTGPVDDCNTNGVDDTTDIINGTSPDADGNGVPDDCEFCPADFDQDFDVDFADNLALLSSWGSCPGCVQDLNGDGFVNFADVLILLGQWGPCPPPVPGACCLADGSCLVQVQDDCLAGGGTYQGDGKNCGEVTCVAPTGACCFPDASCTVETDPDCLAAGGTYQGDDVDCPTANCQPATGACCFFDGTCSSLTAADCATASGTYQGNSVTCAGANCPLPTGACCYLDGSCLEQVSDDCINAGGTFQGLGVTCVAANCQPVTGACCVPDGTCNIIIEADCTALSGIYLGNDSLCADCPEPQGACCLQVGGCASLTSANCAANNGTYQGHGTDCATTECVVPMGACCHPDGSCTDGAFSLCFFSGGIFQGDGTSCATNPCTPTGACCFDDGSCVVDTAADCAAASGQYQGDDVDCVTANCPQPGACCFDDGSCTFELEASCTGASGVFQGEGIDCVTANCPQPGACCFDDGSCTFELEASCTAGGGVFQGEGVDCLTANCPQPGACCLADGSCTFGFASACAASGGVYQGDGITCAAANCPQPGACCFDDGSCTFELEASCTAGSGVFQGEGIDCVTANCPQPGACCLVDGSCTFGFASDCTAAGGTYQGDGITCAAANCPQPGACCFDDGSCTEELEANCTVGGGSFQGEGIDCVTADCPQPGACCFDDGSCTFVLENACTASGGGFQGEGIDCVTANCPQPGACCFDDGSCTFVLETTCSAGSGIFQGEGIDCVTANCPQPGACCFDDGSCTFELETSCTAGGGVFQGEGIDCVTANCPQPGACCFDDGSCTFELETSCTAGGGVFQGEGIDCVTANCPQPGACCFDDGSCTVELETSCTAGGGAFQGEGVDCVTANCPQPGACCFDDGSCNVELEASCTAGGAMFQGEGTDCLTTNCPQPGACCFSDASCTDGSIDDCAAAGGTFAGSGTDCACVSCPTGLIDTIYGTGSSGDSGDGGPASAARFNQPNGLAYDSLGNLYIADFNNNRIRRVDATTGIIDTVAGDGDGSYGGDGGPATSASIRKPVDVTFDAADNMFIADRDNHRIRRVDAATGIITTVAGNGSAGYDGDGVEPTSTRIDTPSGVFVDAGGNLYIADTENNRIRRVNAASGLIETVAGDGNSTYAGDGGQATNASLRKPEDMALDASGNLYIADRDNHRIRRVDTSGIISTFAGDGGSGYNGDGGPASAAEIAKPLSVIVTDSAVIFAEKDNDVVRRVDLATDIISTLAGDGSSGYSGDGGPPLAAQLKDCNGIAVDPDGDLVIGDTGNHRIREVDLAIDNSCPMSGACCFDDGTCTFVLEADCVTAAGTFAGAFIDCVDANCPQPGACCFDDGSCTFILETNCTAGGGVYQGDGVSCVAANCPQPGACCFDDGSCTVILDDACTSGGGIFQGEGVDCVTANCPQPGACCFDDGACTFELASTCTGSGGTYQGDGVDCVTAACPQPGACCFDDGSCTFGFASDCAASGGVYQGDNITCVAANCPQPGACCLADGSCTFGFAGDCTAAGGTYQGDGITCVAANCPQPGACCFSDGSCQLLVTVECSAASGTFTGEGVTCAAASCPQPGACCLVDGSCIFVIGADCLTAGGTFEGEGATCAATNCEQPGACCLDGGGCSDGLVADCDAAGGNFQGEGTSCAGVTCPQLLNDSCAFPETVDCNTTFVYDNTLATPVQNNGGAGDPELPTGSPSCHWDGTPTNTHNTLWYQFVADDTSVEIRTCASAASIDSVIALYDGSCGSLVELACAEDNCGDGGGNQYRSTLCYDGLVPGNTYRFMVANPGGWAGSNPGATTLQITCPCPAIGPVVGACCFADETCSELTPTNCTAAGGTFQGSGVNCTGSLCLIPTGACCFDDGSCTFVQEPTCTGAGGAFQGDGVTCVAAACPQPGACCLTDASCTFVQASACAGSGGTFQGEGVTCATVTCPDLEVLFVVTNAAAPTAQEADRQTLMQSFGFTVTLITASDSQAAYDAAAALVDVAYISEEITSGDVGTKLVAATIGVVIEEEALYDEFRLSAGSGALVTATAIDILDDTHPITAGFTVGSLTLFAPAQDVPRLQVPVAAGARILAETNGLPSLIAVELGDALIGGAAAGRRVALPFGRGNFDINSMNIDGQTLMRQAIEWAARLGPGACCLSGGACTDGLVTDCVASGGVYQGDGTDCGSISCPIDPDGACCFDDASCSFITEAACNAGGGLYVGDGVTCGTANCTGSTLDQRVGTGNDDAEEDVPGGSIDLGSTDLELAVESTTQAVGMRFTGLGIPQGALITSAWIQFQVDEVSTGTVSLTIRGQDADTTSTFTTSNGNVSARPTTAASVAWSPPDWNSTGQAGPDQQTPDLTAIVQEIVDRGGWSSGNSMVMIITGTGTRTAESYNGVAGAAPLLHVEWVSPQ